MSLLLEVYRCGTHRKIDLAPNENPRFRIKIGSSTTLCAASANELNHMLGDCEAPFVTFVDNGVQLNFAELQLVLSDLDDQTDVCLLFSPSPATLRCVIQQLPRQLLTLAPPLQRHSVVIFRRTAFEATRGFADVALPLGEWLIGAERANRGIALHECSAIKIDDDSYAEKLPTLVPGRNPQCKDWLRSRLMNLTPEDCQSRPGSATEQTTLKAGLLQLNDYLDESHQLSQSIEGQGHQHTGDYWHAIMHRREPDYSNSKYWFRRIGRHSVFSKLARQADSILDGCSSPDTDEWRHRLYGSGEWDPLAFVDLCAACQTGPETSISLERAARKIQFEEMLLLLLSSYEDARA